MLHRLLPILIATLVTITAVAEPIEKYRASTDTDWSNAFDAAETACAARVTASPPWTGMAGCLIQLGPAEYKISRPIVLRVPTQLIGQGVGFATDSSRITALGAFDAVQVMAPSVLSHLTILNKTKAPAVYFDGLKVRARVAIYDISTLGGTHGLDFDCLIVNGAGDCSGSTVESSDFTVTDHAAIFVRGRDANAMAFTRVRAAKVCNAPAARIPDAISQLCAKSPQSPICAKDSRLACGGIFDVSAIGNTYIAPLVATTMGYASYVFGGSASHSTAIGAYAEGDEKTPGYPGGFAVDGTNIVGGANVFTGGGQWHGAVSPGIEIASGDVSIKLGSTTNIAGGVLRLANPAIAPWPWYAIQQPSGALRFSVGPAGAPVWQAPWTKP